MSDKSGLLKASGLDVLGAFDDFDCFKVRILRPGITAILGDCMDFLELCGENVFDLALVDPEWGRGEHGGTKRGSVVKQMNGASQFVPCGNYKKKEWDKVPVGREYFDYLMNVTSKQIIWGVNYYDYPFGSGRIVWDKVNGDADQSDCELAYNSMTKRVDQIEYMWNGMMQGKSVMEGRKQQGDKSKNEKRIHPTQKPVILYSELYRRWVVYGWNVLDTHGGSGSNAIADFYYGCPIVIIEKDPEYFEAMCKRILRETAQADLFKPHTAALIAKQVNLFDQPENQ